MAEAPKVATTGGAQGFPAMNSAVPDSNTLLAYKLLQDSWKDNNVFQDLLKEEMKYLVSGISLLQNDPYLQMKLGGVTLNNAGYLANALKQKVSELDLRKRIEPTASQLLYHEFGKPNLRELAPNKRSAVALKSTGDATDPRYELNVLAGQWKNSGIKMPSGDARADLIASGNSKFTKGNGDGIFFGSDTLSGGLFGGQAF